MCGKLLELLGCEVEDHDGGWYQKHDARDVMYVMLLGFRSTHVAKQSGTTLHDQHVDSNPGQDMERVRAEWCSRERGLYCSAFHATLSITQLALSLGLDLGLSLRVDLVT